jgi:hypothetical protein
VALNTITLTQKFYDDPVLFVAYLKKKSEQFEEERRRQFWCDKY